MPPNDESPNTAEARTPDSETLGVFLILDKDQIGTPAYEQLIRRYVRALYKEKGEKGRDYVASEVLSAIPREVDEILAETIVRNELDAISASPGRAVAGRGEPSTKELYVEAEPVMMFDGQFVHDATDISINGGGIAFVFKRTYKNQAMYSGPLGIKWDHNYNLWLRSAGQSIFRSTGTLREDIYERHPKFGTAGFNYWVPPHGQDGILTEHEGSFIWRAPNGVRYFYKRDSPVIFVHRLTRIEDRHGNYLAFSYQGDNLRQVEINHPQRQVTIDYDSQNRIVSILDYSGRQWTYYYDDFGDLVAVTQPGTSRYSEGLTVCYEYSSAQMSGELQHNLTRIIDPSGRPYLENEYGSEANLLQFDRVVRQRQGEGERFFEYQNIVQEFNFPYTEENRPAHQTTLVERNGHPIHYIFNKFGNLLFKEEWVQEDGLQRLLVWRFRYNRDGALIGTISPEGTVTQFLYGREIFIRSHGIVDENVITTHDALTAEVRQGFGRLLATVRRGGLFGLGELDLTRGVWDDIFLDILGVLDAEDIVVKSTYEPVYGQLLSISDPRFTQSADPENPESPEYEKTLTELFYRGTVGDSTLLLDRIKRPTPTLPDGNPSSPIIDRFPDYDSRGRLLQHVNPSGVITDYTYFGSGDQREGHLQRTTVDSDNLAVTTEYGVDILGRLKDVTSPRAIGSTPGHFVTRIEYTSLDQVARTISSPPFNSENRRFYDRNGNLEREENDAKDENGVDIPGAPVMNTFEYDENFNVIQTAIGGSDQSTRAITKYGYDSAGNRVLTVLPEGNRIRFGYDERSLLVTQTIGSDSPDAATISLEYDGDGRVRKIRTARGMTTAFKYDSFGRRVSTEDPLGTIVRRNYDKLGHMTVERVFGRREDNSFVLLARSEFEFDELGRTFRSGVNRFNDPISAANLETDFLSSPGPGDLLSGEVFLDANGRVLKSIDSLFREYQNEYDGLDRVIRAIDPLGNRLESHYDAHSNLIRRDVRDQIHDPTTGDVTERIFSSVGTYDEKDRLIASADTLGNITRYAYDSRNNLVRHVDPLGNVNRANFDIYGRLVQEINEKTDTGLEGGVPLTSVETRYEYDANSNRVAIIDALNRRTTQSYDAVDRHRQTNYPDGSARTFLYDDDGNLIESEDPNGLRRRSTIDGLGRVTRVEVDKSNLDPAVEVEGSVFESYRFDPLGRQIGETNSFAECDWHFNSVGWPLSETFTFKTPAAPFAESLELSRDFDDASVLTRLIYPGGRAIRYHRDELDRITSVENLAKGAQYPGHAATPQSHEIASFEYLGRQRAKCVLGNGTESEYQHDSAGRVIDISHTSGAVSMLKIQYLYDAVGNVRFTNDITGAGEHGQIFRYDSRYQLVEAHDSTVLPIFDPSIFAPATTLPPIPIPIRQADIDALIGPMELNPIQKIFDYDLVGNRTLENFSDGSSSTYNVNVLDQYLEIDGENLEYDLNGNLKSDGAQDYRYDSFNRLVNVLDKTTGNSSVRFFHDARGRRILELRDGLATHLVYNGPALIAEYSGGALFAQYVNDAGMDRPLQIAVEGNEHWYHRDLVGSTRLLTGRTGAGTADYRYSPFGDAQFVGDEPYNPFLYTSRRLDPDLGSYDYRTRQYSPKLGRFLQRDWTGMTDGTNLYQYVGNNPLTFSDPLGTERESKSKATTAAQMFFGGRQALRGAFVPRDIAGSVLEPPYNLWTGSTLDGFPGEGAARGARGHIMEQTPHHQKALDAFNKSHNFEQAWHPNSRNAAIQAGISETPTASYGLDTKPNSQNSIQARIEKKWVGRAGMIPGGFMILSGGLTIHSAIQSDNEIVQIVGMIAGNTEVTGGLLYTIGARLTNAKLMTLGSQFARFGGGVGITVVSGYNLIGDFKRGDLENGVGDAASTATGIFVLLGSLPAAALGGTFAVFYEGTRLLDEPLGTSDDISDRGIRVKGLWNEIGTADWFNHGIGFAGAIPVVGIGVEGLTWGVKGAKAGGIWAADIAGDAYDIIKFW